jgi:hypothetical protein
MNMIASVRHSTSGGWPTFYRRTTPPWLPHPPRFSEGGHSGSDSHTGSGVVFDFGSLHFNFTLCRSLSRTGPASPKMYARALLQRHCSGVRTRPRFTGLPCM